MRLYLAARLSLAPVMNEATAFFERYGHVVTSRWHRRGTTEPQGAGRSSLLAQFAAEDLADIDSADAVVLFTEAGKHFAGGRHVEAGYALGRGKRLIIFGPRENIFYHLPAVVQVIDWEGLRKALAAAQNSEL
jgi:nucleoside 2-deoxyribosyltransferase